MPTRNNLDEIDRFLERHKIPQLIQEEIENLNRPIISKKKKIHHLKSSCKEKPRPRCLHWWILSDISKRSNINSLHTFPENRIGENTS